MTAQIHLRAYTSEDLNALHRMDERCFAPPFRFSRKSMEQFAEAENAFVLVAELDGGVAGFVLAHVQGEVEYIVTLDVDEAFRRKGIAQAMMEQVEAHARQAGCVVIVLHVFERNFAAITFYDHAGFEHVADASDFYGEGIHALVYRLQL